MILGNGQREVERAPAALVEPGIARSGRRAPGRRQVVDEDLPLGRVDLAVEEQIDESIDERVRRGDARAEGSQTELANGGRQRGPAPVSGPGRRSGDDPVGEVEACEPGAAGEPGGAAGPAGDVRRVEDLLTHLRGQEGQALAVGLVDELGNLEDAIKAAAKLAGIKGEPDVVSKKEKISFIDLLRSKFPKEFSDIFPTVKIKYVFSP